MNQFIHRTLIFLFFGLLIVFGFHYAIYGLILSNDDHYVINDEITTIVLGDSHTETSIDNDDFSNLQNYSFKGESLFLSYYKLKRLLDVNPHINHVLLSFSYHSLNEFQDEKLELLLYNYYWLLDWSGIRLISPTSANIDIILKDMNGRLYQWAISNIKQSHYNLITGGYRKLETNTLNNESAQKRIFYHYYADNKTALQNTSTLQKSSLIKIVQLCVDRGVKLTFINTPLHTSYYSNIPEHYISSYYSLIDQLETKHPDVITHLDFKNAVTVDAYFYDSDHLNDKGGENFMKLLKKKLQALLNTHKNLDTP